MPEAKMTPTDAASKESEVRIVISFFTVIKIVRSASCALTEALMTELSIFFYKSTVVYGECIKK
ncbi:MAG: hypothetical protein NVS3B3_05720 [Aquirhabdus sp.]